MPIGSSATTDPSVPPVQSALEQQLRDVNEALLLSALRQQELTEQAEHANALVRATQSRYETVFETSPIGMYVVDADLCIRQMNREALPVFEGVGGLIGRDFVDVVRAVWPLDTANEIVARFRHTLETGEPYSAPEFSDERYDRKVREYYDWQIHRIDLSDGKYGVVCYFTDISARVNAEQSFREQERRLQFVMDSMPQKIVTARPDGYMDYFNTQWLKYTGASVDKLEGWGWMSYIHPDDVEESVRLWQHSVATGENFVHEHRLRHADGKYCWHLSRTLPQRDANGEVLTWIGSNTDVHDQRQASEELRQQAAELSEADVRKNEFLALLAHELRNPLGPIRNAAQVLSVQTALGRPCSLPRKYLNGRSDRWCDWWMICST
ncbi:MAG: PAS domain S-box protein [Gemmatimonadota bacterium]|nr:PAS domain S-box protein [Gemmatimonadota bacterium]